MSFLYPAFLIGALAVAIPIVLHLLRRDVAPEVPFSAVRLLRRAPIEQTRRRRIRDLLLLAARVAALLLLAAAFARPYFTDRAAGSPLRIVAIDRSYSMAAPGAFDRALGVARDAIDASGRGDRVAVIAFDDRAEVVLASGSPSEARSALEAIRPGYGSTRYAPLFARATELAERGPVRLTIVGDMQRTGWEDEEPVAIPASMQVETRPIGAPGPNAAVVGIRREPTEVVATIRNGGAVAAGGNVRVLVDGRPVASGSFNVPASTSVDVPVAYRSPERGALAVEIDDAAGYPADNRRFLVLDPQGRTRVLMVVGDAAQSGFYVTRALQAASDGGFDVRVRAAPALGTLKPAELSQHGALLLLSTRSLDRRARELLAGFVRGGGGLLVAAAADVDASVLASVMEWRDFAAIEQAEAPVALAATDLRHPIFRPFGALAANLGQVRFARAWRVRGEGWDVAARFTDGAPALLERREGKGRVVLFASDLDRRWNDFPLHPSFVPFAVEAIRHITAAPDQRRDYLVGNSPAGVRPEPGAYALGEDGRIVTVNVDVRESTTAAMSADEFAAMLRPLDSRQATPVERQAQQTEGRQNLWRYGVLLMLAALVGESVVGRR